MSLLDRLTDQLTCPHCGTKNGGGVVVITVDALERVLSEGDLMNRVNLQTKHYAVVAAFLVSLRPQLGGLPNGWRDALTPTFIGGLFAQMGTIIAAVVVGSPFARDPQAKAREPNSGGAQ